MKTQKPYLAATASKADPTPQEGGFESRRAYRPVKGVLKGIKRLRTMDGVAPESRFSWLEVSNG